MGSKANSYQNYPIVWKVEILDQDISEYITKQSVGGVASSLDIVDLNKVQRGRCGFTIQDSTGYFDPEKTDNFFTENMGDQSGVGAKIVMKSGFLLPDDTEDLTTIFTGEIQKVEHGAKDFTFNFLCGDASLAIRKEDLTDFGIEKAIELTPRDSSSTGRYPFPSILSPPSRESIANPRSKRGTTLNQADTLKTEGLLNNNNFKVTNNILETEGSARGSDDNPPIDFKAPYRWITIEKIINRILTHYGQPVGEIEVSSPSVDQHITLLGQPGYYIENNDYGEADASVWKSNGFITDFVANGDGDKLYFLYGSPDTDTHPHIIEYNIETDVFRSIYQHTSHLEWWQIAIEGDELFIVGTSTTNYDTKDTGSNTALYKYNIESDVFVTLVRKGDTRSPQMGVYYHFGNVNRLEGTVPDSRKPIFVYNGRVYYFAYTASNRSGCIASVSTTGGTTVNEVNIPTDARSNHLGFCMTRSGTKLYVVSYAATDRGSNQFITQKIL